MTDIDTDTEAADLSQLLPAVWSLLADYARLVDGRQAAEFSRLFGESGTLATPDRDVTGAAALTEFAENSTRGVHVQGVPTVERRADGSLSATSNFIFINALTYNLTSGEYRDEIRSEDGRLVFGRRQIEIRVRTADGPPAE